MKIIYTIEVSDFGVLDHADDVYFQLWYSIYTIRKKWKNLDEIIIFTNDESKFMPIVRTYPKVKIKKAKPEWLTYSGDYGKMYGHSRIFAIPDLLREYKEPILYLDPDTGIPDQAGLNQRNELLNKQKPLAYCTETFNKFLIWDIPIRRIIPNFYSIFEIPLHSMVINNGVLFFPYNDKSIKIADDVIEIYTTLKKLMEMSCSEQGLKLTCGNSWFADMFAISIAWKQNNLDTIVPFPMSYKNAPIIHYYMNKKESSLNVNWKSFREKMKSKYSHLRFN